MDLKPSLIDLEDYRESTGRKQEKSVQRERLSERGYMYCVYWVRLVSHTNTYTEGYVGITHNLEERTRSHKKNKRKTPFTSAIKKYGWKNLIVDVLHDNLSLQDALSIEKSYRSEQKVGWNCQIGGELGVEPSWYNIEENRDKHKRATSAATKVGIALKDSKEARSLRAKENWKKNKESYFGISKGSNNPRAKLNEEQAAFIKHVLLPSGMHKNEIADVFEVKPYVIGFIKYGKTWSHV